MAVKPEPVRESGTKAPRPKDAATLIIFRLAGKNVEVLMGQRHRKHKFLPQRYVFPGGRVERSDSRVRSATKLRPEVEELLTRKATPARARALVATAIRETFEETGLIIGKPDIEPHRSVPGNWQRFFENGIAPSFENLNYVARAVTPAWRPIRFNARFFMIDHKHVNGELGGDGELLDLVYVPLAETGNLELPLITTRILELVEGLVRHPQNFKSRRTVPNFVHNGTFHDLVEE
ncbi:MAG: NUDIX hydrolase [Alphaproteobacteria bacterium]|nr:NUDIX hydrolase [Alphaproteobacteria bacterium]